MATTFCTNHVRQVGIHLYHFLSKKDSPFLRRSLKHLGMLAMFVLGGVIGVFCCNAFADGHLVCRAADAVFVHRPAAGRPHHRKGPARHPAARALAN